MATWTVFSSLVHLDDGEVDLTYHIHVPATSVPSPVSSDVLSSCKGHAGADSPQKHPLLGRIIASAVCYLMVHVLR